MDELGKLLFDENLGSDDDGIFVLDEIDIGFSLESFIGDWIISEKRYWMVSFCEFLCCVWFLFCVFDFVFRYRVLIIM